MKHLNLLLMCIFVCWSCSSGGNDEPIPPKPDDKPVIEMPSSQSSPVVGQTGGTVTVSFTTNAAWTATVSENATRAATWINISPTSGNAGSHILTITTTENDTYDERNATVILKAGSTSKTFTVNQKQKDALTVTSSKIELTAIGGQATIEVKANVQYQYEIEQAAQSWITRTATTRGLTSSSLVLDVAENENTEKREGKITLRSGNLTETVTIYQEGSTPTLVLTQNEYTVGSDGETIKVELKSNTEYEVKLPTDGWITETQTRAFSSHTHFFTVAANGEYDARTAEIIFINKDNGVEEKVKVTQMQQDAIIVAQKEYTVEAKGGTLDFSLNTNVEFQVTTSADWIKQITTRGLTEKQLNFQISENTTDAERAGEITLTSGELKQVIKIRQKGKAVFSIRQKEYTVAAAGENIQVEVTATGEYSVQLPEADWITEVKTRAATTNVHTFMVKANNEYDARSAEILFTDKESGTVEKVKVTQMQQDAIIVAQKEYTVEAKGGALNFSLNTNVEFQVATSDDWIKQVTTRGLTEKQLNFQISENATDAERTGEITLTSGELKQVIKVTQKGKAVFSIKQKEYTVAAAGENIQVEVTATGEYSVQLPETDWITEVKTRAATTNVHTFMVKANNEYDARSAEILFTDKESGTVEKVKVTQMQQDAIIVAQKEYTVEAKGGALNFSLNTNVEFQVTTSDDWIKQVTTRGLTEKQLNFKISENTTDAERAGEITLTSGELKQVIKVRQKGKAVFSIKQKEYTVAAAGENIQVEVTATGEYSVQLPEADWITEVKTRAATTNIHTFMVKANNEYDARSAEILFTDKESGTVEKVKVTQMQQDAIIVAQKEYTVEAKGGTLSLSLSTNVELHVATSTDWIKQLTTRGLTEKQLNFQISENTTDAERTGEITLTNGELKQVIKVRQKGKTVFSIKQKEYTVAAAGENIQVEVTATGEYSVQLPETDWITEVKTRATTNVHTFMVKANNEYDARSAEILFTDKESGTVEKVKVTQKQQDAITIEQNEYAFPAEGGTLNIQIKANIDFTVTASHSWIQQVITRSVTTKTLRFTITENSNESMRVGNIVLKGNNITQTITIKQSGADKTEGGIDGMPIEPW